MGWLDELVNESRRWSTVCFSFQWLHLFLNGAIEKNATYLLFYRSSYGWDWLVPLKKFEAIAKTHNRKWSNFLEHLCHPSIEVNIWFWDQYSCPLYVVKAFDYQMNIPTTWNRCKQISDAHILKAKLSHCLWGGRQHSPDHSDESRDWRTSMGFPIDPIASVTTNSGNTFSHMGHFNFRIIHRLKHLAWKMWLHGVTIYFLRSTTALWRIACLTTSNFPYPKQMQHS